MKRGIIVESNKEENMTQGIVKKVVGGFFNRLHLNVFADEGDDKDGANSDDQNDDDDNGTGGGTINYEDLIAKARKEEKDKQYNTINRLKNENATLTENHNKSLLKIGELETQISDLNKKLNTASKGDIEAVVELKEQNSTLVREKEALEEKLRNYEGTDIPSEEDIEKRVRAELEEEYKVKTYKAEKMAELKGELLVPELVMGTTIEEIDASIESALERSKEIKKSLGFKDGSVKSPQRKRTPKTTNPSVDQVQDKEYSAEYIASLDVTSPEYAEFRKHYGLK